MAPGVSLIKLFFGFVTLTPGQNKLVCSSKVLSWLVQNVRGIGKEVDTVVRLLNYYSGAKQKLVFVLGKCYDKFNVKGQEAEIFVPGKHFQAILLFASKVKGLKCSMVRCNSQILD